MAIPALASALMLAAVGCFGGNDSDAQFPLRSESPDTVLSSSGADGTGTEQQIPADWRPYVVVDLKRQEFAVRLAGATVRQCRFQAVDDSETVADFADEFLDQDTALQVVERVHLLSASKTVTPDELRIISEVCRVAEDQIQRYVPAHMVIVLSNGMRIWIDTDGQGEVLSTVRNTKEKLLGYWASFWGRESLRARMAAHDAMSLYGVAKENPKLLVTR